MSVIQASDARSWVACPRRAWYDHHPPAGISREELDEFDQLIVDMGLEHERTTLLRLETLHPVIEATSEAHTRELMRDGVAVIYQPRLSSADLVGRPDFLIRIPAGDYQAADAKLKRSADDQEILIQVGVYQRLLGNGLPARVFLGDGSEAVLGEESLVAADPFIADMRRILAVSTPPPARYGATKCNACPYSATCLPEFKARGELTLLAGIERRSAEGLEASGIGTIIELAGSDPEKIADVPYLKGAAKRRRAVLQARAYLEDRVFLLEPPDLPGGTWVHFDIETNPLSASGQEQVYLWGLLLPPYDRSGFRFVWTDGDDGDREGWEAFLAQMAEIRDRYPKVVLAHYGHFEVDKIGLYARRYGMADHDVVSWLLGPDSPMLDMCKVVERTLALPLPGRGLKSVCKHPKLVNYQWKDEGSGSQWSVVQYVRFLRISGTAEREQIKQAIIQYNYDDVAATRALELWLRSLPWQVTDQP